MVGGPLHVTLDIFVEHPMTRLLTFSASLFIVLISHGQHGRFFYGLQASPDLAYRSLELVDRNPSSEVIIDAMNRLHLPRLGYTASLVAGYELSERWTLEAGAGYALHGWGWDLSQLTFGDQIDPRRGFVYNSNDVTGSIQQEFHYLNVPVRTTLTLGKGRLRSISSVGASAGILLKANSVTIANGDRNVVELDSYDTFNIFPMISSGLTYAMGERGALRLEPTFRFGALKLREDPIVERLWSAGLQLGYFRYL